MTEALWRGISPAKRRQIEASPYPHLEWMRARVGEKEIPGPDANPLIVEAAKAAGIDWYRSDETAWCAVILYGALAAVGLPTKASALAQSFREYGTPLAYPVKGAIGVIPRGRKAWQGHVFVIDEVRGDTLRTIDGNVSNAIRTSTVKASTLFSDGIRWPEGLPMTPDALEAADMSRAPRGDFGDRLLRKGAKGDDVEDLQRALNRVGAVPTLHVDGLFGRGTERAVRHFQAAEGLAIDGIVGPNTAAALETAMQEEDAGELVKGGQKIEQRKGAVAGGAAVATGGAAVAGDLIAGAQDHVWTISTIATSWPTYLVLAALFGVGGYFLYRWWSNRNAAPA